MDNIFDIFGSDPAFTTASMVGAINKMPFVPGRLGKMGIFGEEGVTNRTVVIEEESGVLYLVRNQNPNGPTQQNETSGRTLIPLITTHLPVSDRIMASELVGVREFGSSNMVKSVMAEVAKRQGTMSRSLDATLEHLMVGAVTGELFDSDGSTSICNLFTKFGVSQESEVDFDLDNASPASGVLRKKCAGIVRTTAVNLGATPFDGIHAFCGDDFFDDLLSHNEVVNSYLGTSMATVLRDGYIYPNGTEKIHGAFEFGGIVWENYRGKVGTVDYINTDKCHFFPVGAPGLFKTYFSPANYVETVGTVGLPKYSKLAIDPQFQKFVDIESQSNPLPICTQPKGLMKGKR